MALPTLHYFNIKHSPGLVAAIAVNDVPFYRHVAVGHRAPSGPFNHMMVPGENTVKLILDEPDPNPLIQRTFELSVMRDSDDSVLFRMNWPEFWDEVPEEERKLPLVHKAKFIFDEPTPKPIWFDAPRDEFPTHGTEEQHAALVQLHDAYRTQDIDAFFRAFEMKTAEFKRFYETPADLEPAAARAQYGAQLNQPWDLDPYDPRDIVFERWAGGRVAYATRKDGRPALFARHKTDPGKAWGANLLMTRVDGQWRIFW